MRDPLRSSAASRLRRLALSSVATLVPWLLVVGTLLADPGPGQQLYKTHCAECHGASGEGAAGAYELPLVGDRSVGELADYIARTMPDGSPEDVTGEDARQVAAYIHDAFYSPIAQARLRPPRIELSRLTVRQYQNAVADLLGVAIDPVRWDQTERGLRGEYYKERRLRADQRVIERTDPVVDFDFGSSSPDPERIESKEFSMRWQGSVFAPETGDYEFVLHTENGARLWVNDDRRALIDAWVRSGDDREHRATIRLLGGRMYPLRLEIFKFNESSASMRLLWKPPGGVEQVIPERCLSSRGRSETFVLQTPFPPDDRSQGYERGTAISLQWQQATTDAAIEVAGFVAENITRLVGLRDEGALRDRRRRGGDNAPSQGRPDNADADRRIREFCHRFAQRAFRRPLDDQERAFFVDRHFQASDDLSIAVKRSILLVLKSPRFLYRDLGTGAGDDYDVAARLALALWDSIPDEPLWEAAAAGRLRSRDDIAAQAARMLGDLRTRSKLRGFFYHWLHLEQKHELSKDSQLFPGFDDVLAADLRASLDSMLDEAAWKSEDWRELVLADYLFVNGRMAKFYGFDLPEDAPLQKISVDRGKYAGVLSHPYVTASFADRRESSPIHRGVFLAQHVLGRFLRPPPEAVTPIPPDLHPDLTTRERVVLQTNSQACMTCHGLINPLGFSLEQFDAAGRFRTEQHGKPVDAAGVYRTRTDEQVGFNGVRELAEFIATSPESHEAFVRQLFHHMVKQPVRAYGPQRPEELARRLAEHQFSLPKILVEIAVTAAEGGRQP